MKPASPFLAAVQLPMLSHLALPTQLASLMMCAKSSEHFENLTTILSFFAHIEVEVSGEINLLILPIYRYHFFQGGTFLGVGC
jgi:hypothetical protein